MPKFRYSYLNLQLIITPNTLVVHLVVSIIGIPSTLILDECEPSKDR